MPNSKQIFVLKTDSLLHNSVMSLLDSRTDFEIASVTLEELAAVDLKGSDRSVVIVVEEDRLRECSAALMALIGQEAPVRVIVIRLSDNVLTILENRTVRIREVVEFLNLL